MKKDEKNKDLSTVFADRLAKETKKELAPVDNNAGSMAQAIARFGQEKLDQWKKQYGNRQLIVLSVGDYMAVLRPPTADDLGDYMTAIGASGLSKAVALIIQNLWIDGDFALIEDEDCFIAVFLQVNNILEGKKAEFFRF